MDRAYEGDETRQLALELGFIPVVPPKQNRLTAWGYNRVTYSDAMRSNGCSAESRASAESSRGFEKA